LKVFVIGNNSFTLEILTSLSSLKDLFFM